VLACGLWVVGCGGLSVGVRGVCPDMCSGVFRAFMMKVRLGEMPASSASLVRRQDGSLSLTVNSRTARKTVPED